MLSTNKGIKSLPDKAEEDKGLHPSCTFEMKPVRKDIHLFWPRYSIKIKSHRDLYPFS